MSQNYLASQNVAVN